MEIKLIRSEADYQAAMKEIDKLMESPSGTPEGDRMDVLVTLVEAYEAKHFPIPEPDDPVGVLEYYMESRLTVRPAPCTLIDSSQREA